MDEKMLHKLELAKAHLEVMLAEFSDDGCYEQAKIIRDAIEAIDYFVRNFLAFEVEEDFDD